MPTKRPETLMPLFYAPKMKASRGLPSEASDAHFRRADNRLPGLPSKLKHRRHLLILLALDDRRIDAIRYYDQWFGMIRQELDISPLPTTRAIIEEIKDLHNAESGQHLRARLVSRDEDQRFFI